MIAGTIDGCASRLVTGRLERGSWDSVLGATLILKGVTAEPVRDPWRRYSHRAPDGGWLPGEPRDAGDRFAALLQGVAYVERLCLDYLRMLGAPADGPLTLTGGADRGPYWKQLRADVLGRPFEVPYGARVNAAYDAERFTGDPHSFLRPGSSERS